MLDDSQRAAQYRRRVRQSAWAAAILLGLLQTWNSRHFMNLDGVSYLDIGDAYLRGDFATAINAYWSPLYSWLTGLTLAILRPSFQYESAVVHALNFFIYLFAFVCFEFLLHGVNAEHFNRKTVQDAPTEEAVAPLPQWILEAVGYTLFLWSALTSININIVNPDMLVAAFAYLATGILLRIRKEQAIWLRFAQLGFVLGLGYLAKSPMLPFAFLFFVTSALAARSLRRAIAGLSLALLCFSLLALPFIVVISKQKGRWTFGDSGRLNYAWSLSRSSNFIPKHPPRLLFEAPDVYEFATPVGGTYPPWYDPSYWHEGTTVSTGVGVTVRNQASVLGYNIKAYYAILFDSLGFFFAIWLVALIASFRGRETLREIAAQYRLLLPPLGVLAIYLFVLIQPRYVIPFVVLLYLGLLAAIRLPASETNRRWIKGIAVSLVFMLAFSTIFLLFRATRYDLTIGQDNDLRVATGLKKAGVQAGEKVAYVGGRNSFYWARLAQIRVLAEIRRIEEERFWQADEATKQQLFAKLREAGINLLVTSKLPETARATGWQAVEGTEYGVYLLNNSTVGQDIK